MQEKITMMNGMDEEIKKRLKRTIEKGEISLTRSLLRWRYGKAGKETPQEHQLEKEAEKAADRMRQVISRRSQNVWSELKKTAFKGKKR